MVIAKYPDYPLSERAKIFIAYLLAGHELYAEGRTLVFDQSDNLDGTMAIWLAAKVEVQTYENGEMKISPGLVGYNVSLMRFLDLLQHMNPGDFLRMEQVLGWTVKRE